MQPGLIIVSNRLPVSVKRVDGKLEFFPSVGGLATGLASYAADPRNKWIGWPGIASDDLTEKERQQIAEELAKSNCYPVFLTHKQIDDYYNGYCNSILWPLFHDSTINTEARSNESSLWRAYQRTNALFAEAVLALSNTNDTIWVHDYQLLILPALLRLERPYNKIGFFLHIPFPAAENFATLADGEALVAGMLGADLIGLHVESYVNNFLDTVNYYDSGITEHHKVILRDRVVRVTDFPMGIDYGKYEKARRSYEVESELVKLRLKYYGQKVILTVDRLDPAKGLVERATAYQTLLRSNPRLRGKVVLVMLVVPSRTDIKEYQELKARLETLIVEINKEFGTPFWKPIDYLPKALPFEQVTAFYRRADIAFITPLRDGMNLVAKEYLASKPYQHGILILSKTAGAAEELKDAIVVDPSRPATLVNGLVKALAMPPKEFTRRARRMQKQLSSSTVHVWAKNFRHTLQQETRLPGNRTASLSAKLSRMLLQAYKQAGKRLILLDYDGVLEPFHREPEHARPDAALMKLLKSLSKHAQIVIVSGRRKADLEEWFGAAPVALVAEHGLYTRKEGEKTWHKHPGAVIRTWRSDVLALLQRFADKTPGAFVEEKDASLVWHYRRANSYYAQKNLVALKRLLRPLASRFELHVVQGNKILEVRAAHIHKGTAALAWLKTEPEFVLALGDDYTDEDMFSALPREAYTIKVGCGRTAARYRLKNVSEVLQLLSKLSS
jgi:trehalose 6-phosphate synthase/phosphatase